MNLFEKGVIDVVYLKDGWLFMCRLFFVEFFFFNFYFWEFISLLDNELLYKVIVFFFVFILEICILVILNRILEYIVVISICYFGVIEWIIKKFYCYFVFGFNVYSNFFCVNDCFYCFILRGVLFEFDLVFCILSY